MEEIGAFLHQVISIHARGNATEHTYRPALERLFNSLAADTYATNEPKRIACGAPDFILERNGIPVGYVEAKDLNVSIRQMSHTNTVQMERYRKALPNLIYTNCLDWDFYRDGELIASVTIGELAGTIQPCPDRFSTLTHLLRDFAHERPQSITSPSVLAERMAGKAILIKEVLHNALVADAEQETALSGQYISFKESLISDITLEDFADMYAETIAYGMFAARLHDSTLETFNRQEAQALVPKNNPFLRNLFTFIAGSDLDDSVAWVIDDLAAVFQAADVAEIMKGFGTLQGRSDPFLHFYETFLAAYNPLKRKSRGVWYTPEAVVQFIVRAVDDVLQSEFDLELGLADTSKVTIDWDTQQTYAVKGRKKNTKSKETLKIKKDVHRVQILDPATGTGTFLAEVIKQVAPRIKDIAPGRWSGYLEESLIPRLHGFELLMASYAMCHMKLDMVLKELGYEPSSAPPRLSVYLTNSLDDSEREVRDLLMTQWLSREAREANNIKRQTPIMCVIGNPPYSGVSQNKGDWIEELVGDYKFEPGGKIALQERKHWLNDDYVKFIRFSEHLIERNGEGVLAFVTNHGYLENPTFRGMRWRLLQTFDRIYVIDLHGNANKKEVAPNGAPDKNVFDIQQGVAIIVALRRPKRRSTANCEVYRADMWGSREAKYRALRNASLANTNWTRLKLHPPQYAFVQRDNSAGAAYESGFSIRDFMPVSSIGMVTARDALSIDMYREALWERIRDFVDLPEETARQKYRLRKDVRDWKVSLAQADVRANYGSDHLIPIVYRPFDSRWAYYTGNSRGIMASPCANVMQQMTKDNVGLVCTRTIEGSRAFSDALVVDQPITLHSLSIKESNTLFPLYLYGSDDAFGANRTVNFDPALFSKMRSLVENSEGRQPNELEVFDYIYGVLYLPEYRAKFSSQLKTDFPRIMWPESPRFFWKVSSYGASLREVHLFKRAPTGAATYRFVGDGDAIVGTSQWRDNRVWINSTQYFDDVPEQAWNLWIGGYQPAQKWLKDRKGRPLSFDEIRQYQRLVAVLVETERMMASGPS